MGEAGTKEITWEMIRNNEEINLLIENGNRVLKAMGFTEHSRKHAAKVADMAGQIAEKLGYDEHTVKLSRMAGYMHDIGNIINRSGHAHSGAILTYQILKDMGMPLADAIKIATAIGHHDESTGGAIDEISACLILADKTDVRRNRVQSSIANFDIHDRVNYAALSSALIVEPEKAVIRMELKLDDTMCSVMDYFEIFLERMTMCKRAAETLGCVFKLAANGNKLC